MAEEPVRPADLAGDVTKWTTVVTGVLAVLTTIGGSAAALSGSADRMFREQPLVVLIAALAAFFGFAFLGLALAVGPSKRQRQRWIGYSILCFFAALAFGTVAVMNTSGTADQPGLTGLITTTDGQPKLDLTVTASGLRSDERINVLVSGVSAENKRDPRPLFATVIGANRDGVVSGTFSVNLGGESYAKVAVAAWAVKPRPFLCGEDSKEERCRAQGEPNCNVVAAGETDRSACLLLSVPGSARRPSLDLAMTRVEDALTLVGTVSALPLRGQVVYLSIYPSGNVKPMYATKLVPALDGSINASLALTMDPSLAGICIVAMEGSPFEPVSPPCPVPNLPAGELAASTTWLALTAPPRAPEASATPPIEPEVTLEP